MNKVNWIFGQFVLAEHPKQYHFVFLSFIKQRQLKNELILEQKEEIKKI